MSNKGSLRELQARLAERMQAAQAQPRTDARLAVECRGHGLLFPLHQAGEIFPVGALLPVPHTKPWFVGVANLRGGLNSVVDLARFLDLADTPLSDQAREQARLVALNPRLGVNAALLVDRLAGLRGVDQLTVEPADGDVPRPRFAGERRRDADGRVWQEILLDALAEDMQFLGIAR